MVVRRPFSHFHPRASLVSGDLSFSWNDALPGTNGRRQPTVGLGLQLNSIWHVAEQPSPLVVLPSSHSSPQPASTIPLPQSSESPVHTPATHMSSRVQVWPSLQLVPSGWASSVGHAALAPVQFSAASHASVA